MTIKQETKEQLTDDKSLEETVCPIKKSVKPLIEIISDNSAISKDSEQISKQNTTGGEKESHDFKDILNYHPEDVNT